MSNGYLVAAAADALAAREIGDGFGLDVIETDTIGDRDAVAAALASAANVGLMLSTAAAGDEGFVAFMQTLAQRLARAQLIVVDDAARAAFAFLPEAWPAMSLDEARTRAEAIARQREPASEDEPARAHPLPPQEPAAADDQPPAPPEGASDAPPPAAQESPEEPQSTDDNVGATEQDAASDTETLPESGADDLLGGSEPESEDDVARSVDIDELAPAPDQPEQSIEENNFSAGAEAPPAEAPVPAAPPHVEEAPPQAEPPPAPAPAAEPPQAPPVSESRAQPDIARKRSAPPAGAPPAVAASTAPADATAFAPKKLRRGTPELVRLVVHQPKDLQAVIKAAKKLDPRTEPAPSGMSIGEVALGANIGVALEVRGASCGSALERRPWAGEPIDFSFAVEAEDGVKQVVFLARVFVDDAQIGVLAFTRNVTGPNKKPHSPGDRARLKRHKRVFLSYSSQDRETVAAIATAYQAAGIDHFWDRTSLKSGEEWHPRLRREIDRADLFHLCWSRAAAQSEWVKKEAEHALTRRRRKSGRPDITVQMLDGPPWAAHPPELDAINFDDFVRAAIVGYARGDGSQ